MYMSEEEIVAKYKRNGCTHEQIGIIADLNAVPDYVIRKILREHGAMDEVIKKKERQKMVRMERAKLTPELEAKIVELQQKGFTQKQIAIKCNVTTRTIHNVYKKFNLKGRNTGKVTQEAEEVKTDDIKPVEVVEKAVDDDQPETTLELVPEISNTDNKEYSTPLLRTVLEKIDSKVVRWRSEPRFMQLCRDSITRLFKELEI